MSVLSLQCNRGRKTIQYSTNDLETRKFKKISCLNKFGMREASKPIAWYANILVSLPVESEDEEKQQAVQYFSSNSISET
jgi:hypothetical protein